MTTTLTNMQFWGLVLAVLVAVGGVFLAANRLSYKVGEAVTEVKTLGAEFKLAIVDVKLQSSSLAAVPYLSRQVDEVHALSSGFAQGLARLQCDAHHTRIARVETDLEQHDKRILTILESNAEERGARRASQPDVNEKERSGVT